MASVIRGDDNFDSGDIDAGLGSGQTWQSPTRAWYVIYQNTTGKAIQVSIGTGAQNTLGFRVGTTSGSLTEIAAAAYYSGFQCIIPDGHYYEAFNINGGSVNYWNELR